MEPPTPEEIATRHRYMAVEANNLAWQLSVVERTQAEDQEMLHAAHTAAWHWSKVGTELHHMRAVMLLAEVHALCGLGQTAHAYSHVMFEYFTSRETEPWELAFTHTIHARVAFVAGRVDDYHTSYAKAMDLIASLNDEDRPIVEKTFNSVPKPTTIG